MLRFAFEGVRMPHSVAATMSQCSKALANLSLSRGYGAASAAVLRIPTPRNKHRRHHSIACNFSFRASEVISAALVFARWSHQT